MELYWTKAYLDFSPARCFANCKTGVELIEGFSLGKSDGRFLTTESVKATCKKNVYVYYM